MKTLLLAVFGALFVAWGIHGVAKGCVWVPVRKSLFGFGTRMKWIHRSEEPARFWIAVGLLWILGGALILNTLSVALRGEPILGAGR